MATVTNLNPNPRAAANATGAEAGPNGSGTPSAVADAAFPLGTAFSETSTPADATKATGISLPGFTGTNWVAVVAGDFCVFRCKAKVHAGAGTPTLRFQVTFSTSGGSIIQSWFVDARENCTPGTGAGNVYELIGFAKAPATAARLSATVTQLGSTGSTIVRVSEFMTYRNPPAGVGLAPYADVTATYLPPARPDPNVLLYGYNDNNPIWADRKIGPVQWAQMLVELGANCVRFGSDMGMVEMFQPADGAAYNFAPFEPWLNAAIAAGIKPILVSPAAPSWMRGTNAYIPTSGNLAKYANLCAAFAARFPEACAFEWWNEPNIVWGGAAGTTVDMAAYVSYLQAIYPKVKAAVPNMPVIAGSSACVGFNAGANEITADAMWSQFYSNGGKNFCDGLSLHPYPQRQSPTIPTTGSSSVLTTRSMGVEEHLRIVRKYKDANGDSAKPLWLTEGGGNSSSGFLTEAEQATFNRLYVEVLANRARHPDMRYIGFNEFLHHVNDGSQAQGAEHVENNTFRRKATFGEVRAAFGGGRPSRRPVAGPVNRTLPAAA